MSDALLPTIDPETLVTQFGGIVTSIATKMIQDQEKAKDAAQEAWCEIIKSLPTFKGLSKPSTWIYRISSRVILKFAKKERIYSKRFIGNFFALEPEHPLVKTFYRLDTEPEGDKHSRVKQRCKKCLIAFLHCLNAEARLILILHDLAGLPFKEISEIFEKKEDHIRQIVSRARRRVNNFLEGNCVLFNADGKCTCHLKQQVTDIDLAGEYSKLRESVKSINVFKTIDWLLPEKNFWKTLL